MHPNRRARRSHGRPRNFLPLTEAGRPIPSPAVTARLLLILILMLSAIQIAAAELMVFAAASLTDVLQEIGRNFEQRTGAKVLFNFSASSILARQIQEGANTDLFFSADDEKMDALEKRGLVEPGTRRPLLSNSLVVAVAKDSSLQVNSPKDLRQAKRVAIAEPNTVPAGIYARRFLIEAGLWHEMRSRIVPTENVRGALAAVEAGNVDAAIVYKTDAAMSRKAHVALELASKVQIVYPVAVLKESKAKNEARKFLEHLESAREVFEKHGFVVLQHGQSGE